MTGAIHLAFRFSARLTFGLCAKRRVNLVSWHRCLGTGAVFRHSCLGTHFEHRATPAVGVPKLQLSLCTAAAAAPLLEGVSEERPESPVHAPLPVSVMVHASAEIEHPIVVAANLSASIADPGAGLGERGGGGGGYRGTIAGFFRYKKACQDSPARCCCAVPSLLWDMARLLVKYAINSFK